ncbi:hypothetical protein GCM10010112_93610 [Actinoplanes lobatus]|uniref:Uncharacterized protein n=1 Tax=Actinoplanes lobatus TaxID=113568 RepID=A0A7W7HJS0_9ACTN|nr:hypothetical protein [Actinoplanes lobatus]MBB4751836.1 hypothetical protein [Actinoplanes lobatus]GGN99627.1 hypothetical protein GCM10010112_93610 [Actinoplanes lobatus]
MGIRATASAGWQSRPGRRALVAADLSTLRGPVSGIVDLPFRLVWAPPPAGRFDLDDGFDRRRMYEIVLREAVRHDELQTWLNGELLVALWPRLYLPRGLRQAWEAAHPVLVAVAVV